MSDNDLKNVPGAPLTPWGPKQPLDHRRLNRMQSEPVYDVKISGPLVRKVSRMGGTVTILTGDSPGSATENRRVRVTTANVSTSPPIQLVKDIDADDDVTGDEFPVRSLCKMKVDDDLYVFRPTNGIGGSPTYGGDDVIWRDMRFPGEYPATLTKTSGSRGSNTTAASWLYDVYLRDWPTKLLESVGPEVREHPAAANQATKGRIYIDGDGVVTLTEAREPRVIGAC